jgi:transcriptional regulator with XRE-family HTH domain
MQSSKQSPKNEFSLRLKMALAQKEWSAQKLADESKIDGGLMRAFLRGDRLPPKNQHQEMIRKIAQALGLPSQSLQDAYDKDRQRRKRGIPTRQYLKRFSIAEPIENVPIYGLGDQRVIQGQEEFAGRLIRTLEKLEAPSDANRDILVSFNSENSIFHGKPELEAKWQKATEKKLADGWNIRHIVRLNDDNERTFEIVSNLLKFLGLKGTYDARVFKQRVTLFPSYGLFLIPGKEGFLAFSASQPNLTDSAIHLKVETGFERDLEILVQHFNQLMQQTEPIYKKYDKYDDPELRGFLQEADRDPGDRIVILKRLSEITHPENWYQPNHPWAIALSEFLEFKTQEELKLHLETRKQRRKDLLTHLETKVCRYIYPKSCIRDFIRDGSIHPHYFEASNEHRYEQIKQFHELLKDNSGNYGMALLDDDEEDRYLERMKPQFCEVQGHHLVLMEVWDKEINDNRQTKSEYSESNQKTQRGWYLVRDANIVKAFQEHFSKIWKSIDEKNRDSVQLGAWLEESIKSFEQSSHAKRKSRR